MAQHKKIGRY